tara:strand:- start:664 stop:1173 length:510 start_codon:yes stop_codon:yes gene_type:complete
LRPKLKIETTFDFGKLANSVKSTINEFKEETIKEESGQMSNRLKSGKTIDGQMKPLSEVAKITRILRGHNPSSPPLNASGKLLNSIKAKKTGISAKEYGVYHNRGFVTQNNPVIPEGNKRPKGGLRKRQFKFKGKAIPQRQWIHTNETFKYNNKLIKKMFDKFAKALKK